MMTPLHEFISAQSYSTQKRSLRPAVMNQQSKLGFEKLLHQLHRAKVIQCIRLSHIVAAVTLMSPIAQDAAFFTSKWLADIFSFFLDDSRKGWDTSLKLSLDPFLFSLSPSISFRPSELTKNDRIRASIPLQPKRVV